MLDTHYEKYIRRLQPHRRRMREIIGLMKQDEYFSASGEGTWISEIMQKIGKVEICGKDYNLIPQDGPKGLSDSFDAFVHELMVSWYAAGIEDGKPLSISRTILTNVDFMMSNSLMSSILGREQAQTVAEMTFQLASHERAGQKVYEVVPQLAEDLLHTELRGVKCEDVKLPFPSVYLTVPLTTGFKVWNYDTGWHNVVGVYISEDQNARREPAGRNIQIDYSNRKLTVVDGKNYDERPVLREWNIMVVGGPSLGKDGKPIDLDDALYYFRLYFPEGESIESAIQEVGERHSTLLAGAYDPVHDRMKDTWEKIFKWCMNVIVYATYTEPGESIYGNAQARKLWDRIREAPEGSKTRRNLLLKAKNIEEKCRIMLGKNIVINRSKVTITPKGAPVQNPLTVRVRVSGFWRNQPHGHRRSLRRLQWIEPYWRGPEWAEVSSNRHVLK